MKIFVDENIPLMTVRALREMGHIVTDIRNTPDKEMAWYADCYAGYGSKYVAICR